MDLVAPNTELIGLVRDFALALAIGALIGLEREHQAMLDREGGQFGGLRTFTLIAGMGALAAWLGRDQAVPALLAVGFLGLVVLLAVGVHTEGRVRGEVPGLTSEVAALLTYLLGAAVLLGHPEVAVMLAVATLAVLAFKQRTHAAVRALGRDDIVAGLKLLAATFVVLPLLPDRALDPWGALNPYRLWWLVILISSLSLVGYVAVRALGSRRGYALTGLFGGLVSSTAVTLTLARRSRETADAALAAPLAVGILLAWAVMFVRVVIEVAVVHAPLLDVIAVPMGAMALASAVAVGWLARTGRGDSDVVAGPEVELKNPFNLTSAIQFGAFFALVLVVARLAEAHVPTSWLYAVAALAGATDVDAITLSMAGLARDGLASEVAVLAILIASWSNTAVKCAMVLALGSRRLAARTLAASALVVVAGALGVALGPG